VETGPDLIVAAGTASVQALRRRTELIPIVFINVVDPVGNGLVANLAKPGGATTGFAGAEYAIVEKWLELIKEVAPRANRIGLVFNPDATGQIRSLLQALEAPAAARTVKLVSMPFRADAEIEKAIEDFAKAPNGALLTIPDSNTVVSR